MIDYESKSSVIYLFTAHIRLSLCISLPVCSFLKITTVFAEDIHHIGGDALIIMVLGGCLLVMYFVVATKTSDVMVTLDGSQYLSSSLITRPIHKDTLELRIVFKTRRSSCRLFYASGWSGDFMALELYHGKLRYIANSNGLVTSHAIEIIHGGGNFADGNIYQVNVDVGEYTSVTTYSMLGNTLPTVKKNNAMDKRFDLDEISYYLGMPASEKTDLFLSEMNFKGCVNVMSFDNREIELTNLKPPPPGIVYHGNLMFGCKSHWESFFRKSFKLTGEPLVVSVRHDEGFALEFYLQTYLQEAIVFEGPHVEMRLSLGHLVLRVNLTKYFSIALTHNDGSLSNGVQRKVCVHINDTSTSLQIDSDETTRQYRSVKTYTFGGKLIFGGASVERRLRLIGCMENIRLGIQLRKITDFFINTTVLDQCQPKDFCFPINPCLNGGRCVQNTTNFTCNCTGTGFTGRYCHAIERERFLATCNDYCNAGYSRDGVYIIQPRDSKPFRVKCEFSRSKVATIIETNSNRNTPIFSGNDHDSKYFFHRLSYKGTKAEVRYLIRTSAACRQYVRYNCYDSVLMNSKLSRSEMGVRWYTREGTLKNHWPGGRGNNSRSCACSLANTCGVNKKLACHCDVKDRQLRFDDGYVTEKRELPISMLRVSMRLSNVRSSIEVGPLECFGESFTVTKTQKTKAVGELKTTALPHVHYNSTVSNTKSYKTLSDLKLAYIIIATVIASVVMVIVVILVKRRFCSNARGKTLPPQIVRVYDEDYPQRDNNFKVNNDITLNVGVSCRDTISESSSETSRYFNQDCEENSPFEKNLYTKKGILKIKRDSLKTRRRWNDHDVKTTSRDTSLTLKQDIMSRCTNYNEDDFTDVILDYSPLKSSVRFATDKSEEDISFLSEDNCLKTLV